MSKSKSDLIAIVAEQTGKTKTEVKHVLDVAFINIKLMAAEDTLQIYDFGVFKTKTRAARAGRNPMTGAALQIPESKSLSFKATKTKS